MKKAGLLLLILSGHFLFCASMIMADVPAPKLNPSLKPMFTYGEKEIDGLSVTGSGDFQDQIERALQLLRSKSYYDLEFVKAHVKRIIEESHSAAQIGKYPPTIMLHDHTAFYSLTWCAASLVHEACHFKQAAIGIENVPYEHLPMEQKRELECIWMQIATLKKIGAPESEIHHSQRQLGDHYDVNKDGKYTKEDYDAIKW